MDTSTVHSRQISNITSDDLVAVLVNINDELLLWNYTVALLGNVQNRSATLGKIDVELCPPKGWQNRPQIYGSAVETADTAIRDAVSVQIDL